MKTTAIIAAGGTGERLGGGHPKQFREVAGKPMIIHTLLAFEKSNAIDSVVVALPTAHLEKLGMAVREKYGLKKLINVIPGGPTRQASVFEGLKAIAAKKPDYVAVHDAARCLISPSLIDETVHACQGWDGAIAAVPVRDTLKKVDGHKIQNTQNRNEVWAMQTPQVFPFSTVYRAYERAEKDKVEATDDSALVEKYGGRVRVVHSSYRNMKVTHPEDMELAAQVLTSVSMMKEAR